MDPFQCQEVKYSCHLYIDNKWLNMLYLSGMLPGHTLLLPYHEPVVDYRRCYDILATKGELFVTLELNPLPVYDCIDVMDLSLNVSGVEKCSYYHMYKVSDNPIVGNVTSLTGCIQTMEEPVALFTYCRYQCQPSAKFVFGWSGSLRLQNRMTICDLRWNYVTC